MIRPRVGGCHTYLHPCPPGVTQLSFCPWLCRQVASLVLAPENFLFIVIVALVRKIVAELTLCMYVGRCHSRVH